MSASNKKHILLAILIPIIILVAIVFAMYYLQNKEIKQDIDATVEEEKISGVEIYDTYSENAITFTEKELKINEDNEVGYVQISGLKNKTVQESINTEIENLATEFYNEHKNDESAWFYATVQANFANVLSIDVSCLANNINYETGLNYNLITGEKLNLKDLFTSTDEGKTVIRKAAYEELIWKYSSETDEGIETLKAEDYGEIEDEILEIMYAYNSNKLTDFYFTPLIIGVIYNDEGDMFFVNMNDYAEYIGIYNRYTEISDTEIYEDTSIAKTGMYCITYRQETLYEILEETDNYYLDLNIIQYDEEEYPDEVINRAKELIDEKYQEIQNINIGKDEFYIFNLVLQIDYDTEDEENIYNVEGTFCSYHTTTNLWNDTYKKELIQRWRYVEGEANITNYVNVSLDVKESESYSLRLNSNGKDIIPTKEEAIGIAENLADNFALIENEWEEEIAEYGEVYYTDLDFYFTEKRH